MRHLKHSIYLIICLLSFHTTFAQELRLESTNYDFGSIAESGGEVTTQFTAINSGDKPLVIVTAKSSCGCTTPQYSRKPIAPGEQTSIEVAFDPMNRPGTFAKTVEIITAPDSRRYLLTITGDVEPRERTIEELYPFDMGGGVRFGANYFPFGQIEQGERRVTQVNYINTSKRSATLTLRPTTKSDVVELDAPATIAAGERSSFDVIYDLESHRGYYGTLSDRYTILVGGKESPYNLILNGQAIDHFSDDDRSAPPIFNSSTRIIKLGEIAKSRHSSHQTFLIENSGVNDLVVRAVDLGEGVHTSLKAGNRVEAGATLSVEVWVDSSQFDYGNFSRYLTLTVNDPDQPVHRVRITGVVIDK